MRVSRGRESVIRRARGYAPLPVRVDRELPPVLAVGGHLKNTVAIAVGRQVFVSQHVGDLETVEARRAFERAIDDLCRLFGFRRSWWRATRIPTTPRRGGRSNPGCRWSACSIITPMSHACAAENNVRGAYLGVAWDGTGYGPDGINLGRRVLPGRGSRIERVAHLRPFRLPGGEAAIREGWRAACGLRFEVAGAEGLEPIVGRMLERGVNSPATTSVGRLFDAVAATTGVAPAERLRGPGRTADGARDCIDDGRRRVFDCRGHGPRCCASWRRIPPELASAKFHNGLVEWILEVARAAGVPQVVMSGGVFQNRYLVDRAVSRLEANGFAVHTHQRVPPNDGGIALGQAVLAGIG